MKELLLIIALIIYSSASFTRNAWVDNKEMCEKDRGLWRMFANDCADVCESKFDHTICASNPIYNCECGESRCWDGNKCIANKVAKLAWEEKTKSQREQRIKELKELEIKISQFKAGTVNNVIVNSVETNKSQATNTSVAQTTNNATKPATNQPAENQPVTIEKPPTIAPIIDPIIEQKNTEQKDICEKQSGVWQQFSNGCVDSCSSKIAKISMCTMDLTFGCKCGENKCWDGDTRSCVENEKYKQSLEQTKNINSQNTTTKSSTLSNQNNNSVKIDSTLPPLPIIPDLK